MQITINGNKRETAEQISIAELLIKENLTRTEGIAIAVNLDVVPKNEWEKHLLKENDQILIIKAAQGG